MVVNLKNHAKLALVYFLLAAILGVVLRSYISVQIRANYRFIVHTHSHIALLGWVYMALTTLYYKLYLNKQGKGKKYRLIFWFTQCTLVGMLLSFPFQGYALFSIIFSTLFLFASYWFTWFFIENTTGDIKKTHSYICVKAGLWYMVLSTLGPWSLGIIMNTLGPTSIWYRLSIYFYLHFQYNAWMILALVGLLFYIFEKAKIQIPQKEFKRFLWHMNLGIVLTFFLSTLWANPPIVFHVLGALGALFQISAFVQLVKMLFASKNRITPFFTELQFTMLKIAGVLLGVKMVLQLLSSLPYVANLAVTYLDFTIGYLHMVFLGVVTFGLFFLLDFFKLIQLRIGAFGIYLIGFLFTEILIFHKGIAIWQGFTLVKNYFEILAVGGFLIPLALVLILMENRKSK